MAIENVVIAYLADISNIKRSVTQIANINKQLAQKMGADFSKGFSVISSELKKVQFDKQFKIKITGEKGFKKVRGTIRTFEKTVRTADGQLFKFTETIGKSAKGSVVLATSINKVAQAQSKLTGASSKLATRFTNLKNVNATFSKQLGSFGQVSKLVGTNLNQLSDDGSKVSKIFETTNGKFVQLTQTTKRLPGGVQQVTRSVKQLSKAQAQNAKVLERSNTSTRGFAQNLKSLAGRALLTIPVWFALRRSVQAVFTTIRDGLTAIVDFDRALQKAKRGLQGTAQTIGKNFDILREEVLELSIETGRSVDDITKAFQRFITVGFDFETSMAGANSATKLSILLFGDAEETANAFARTMRVLADRSENAIPISEQLANVMALTSELWKTNAFELNELTSALERFAPGAKVAGFSAGEAVKFIAALSTAALRGSKAGRLLSTSLVRLVTKTDELAKSLGVKVNPEVDRTFDVFLRVLDALEKTRAEAGKISPEFEKIVKSIFGLRSGLAVKGLLALRENLKKVLATEGDILQFNKDFQEVNESIFQLVAQFKNLNREIGRAFVTGLLGAGNFQKSLNRLIGTQKELVKSTERFGNRVRDAFLVTGIAGIIGFRKQLIGLLALLAKPVVLGAFAGFVVLNFKSEADRLEKEAKESSEVFLRVGEEFAKAINKGFRGELSIKDLEILISKLEVFGADLAQIPTGSFDRILDILKKIRKEQVNITKEQENQIKLSNQAETALTKRIKISEIVLKNELEILKTRGASVSELLIAEGLIRKQLDIQKDDLGQLKDKLDLEREINKEKRLENDIISATSQKLAEIGREEGVEIARKISDVLSKKIDFNLFARIGGKPLEVFQKEFPTLFQQQLDIKFLQRKGLRIPLEIADEIKIRDVEVRTPIEIRQRVSQEQRRSEQFIKNLNVASVNNTTALKDNTFTIKELITNFQRGIIIIDDDAERLRIATERIAQIQDQQRFISNIPVQRVTTAGFAPVISRSIIDFNLVIDGRQIASFIGTPEAIDLLIDKITPAFQAEARAELQRQIDNPQSPTNKNINFKVTGDPNNEP